ncbi:MAG: hypothetical protein R2771_10685 [Saprospiraceae bacterium]
MKRHAKAVSKIHKVTVLHVAGDDISTKFEIVQNVESEEYSEVIVYFKKHKWSIINFIRK